MAEQHKAKRVHWLAIEADSRNFATASTILELLHRIEALEAAAQQAKPNHPAKPDSSLMDQVEDAVDMARGDSEAKARAAIREVAAWLREENPSLGGNSSAFASLLEQEAMQ